ncbi:hypothetical protein MMC06_002864 [Schaereria dolodes]|nr:hypothetical protein [Schaereria dolodes]
MYDDPEAWIEYVYALDRMRGGKEMINVLSCIHQHPRFHDVDLRTIEYITTAQSHQLSHRTIRQLRKLCHMRTGRQPHRQMELRIRDRSYERSPRYLAPPPLHLEGSKILMDPISGVTERMHKGSHIHPEELLQICEQDPSSILVKDRGLHGLPFNNPHYPLELEDDYGSETSTERGERLSEEPWDYPGIVQPPWDARSGSPFRGHHRPVRVIRAS